VALVVNLLGVQWRLRIVGVGPLTHETARKALPVPAILQPDRTDKASANTEMLGRRSVFGHSAPVRRIYRNAPGRGCKGWLTRH
jgi:hypothetical protein